jgi:hypothetical protein
MVTGPKTMLNDTAGYWARDKDIVLEDAGLLLHIRYDQINLIEASGPDGQGGMQFGFQGGTVRVKTGDDEAHKEAHLALIDRVLAKLGTF